MAGGRRVVYVHVSNIGSIMASDARSALDDIDEELGVFVSTRGLAGPQAILEATSAMASPGREGDY